MDFLSKNLSHGYLNKQDLNSLVIKYAKCKDSEKKIELRDIIFDNCIRFIRKRTLAIVNPGSDFVEDAFQSACIGFMLGLDKYDYKKKSSFLNYISFYITKYVYSEFHSRNIIRLDKDIFNKPEWQNHHNRSLVYFDKLTRNFNGDVVDSNYNSMDVNSLAFEEEICAEDNMNYYKKIADNYLSEIERAVFKLKYFFETTNKEIAYGLKISRQAVDMTESRALDKIRRIIKMQRVSSHLNRENKGINIQVAFERIKEYRKTA